MTKEGETNMQKVAVIGGGASGLMAAIYAKTNRNEVVILERNNICAKKLLMTGNGRCNYWNQNQSLEKYHSMSKSILKQILTQDYQMEVLQFFEKIGIVPKIRDGYYYPYSNQATSIKEALLSEVKSRGIGIITNCMVEGIRKEKDQFQLTTSCGDMYFTQVIVATGSCACPKTGSDGNGYQIATSFGHSIVPVLPSLVPLKIDASFLKDWSGVRSDVELTLYDNHQLVKKERGEIQLTDYGISGICVFNFSGIVARGLQNRHIMQIAINFVPFLNAERVEDVLSFLLQRALYLGNRPIDQMLEGFLNYKLIYVILKQISIKKENTWNTLTKEQQRKIANCLFAFQVDIIDTKSFDHAQVCSGGMSLLEIDPLTMESVNVDGLYFTGELLDVDGDCGGYNLSFAWISGMLAGKGVLKYDPNSTN